MPSKAITQRRQQRQFIVGKRKGDNDNNNRAILYAWRMEVYPQRDINKGLSFYFPPEEEFPEKSDNKEASITIAIVVKCTLSQPLKHDSLEWT